MPAVEGDQALDVIIVGAGLSGVGAAAKLLAKRPGTTFAVLEGRGEIGGTWDLFRYPGVRSDSDMYTLAYPWRPWNDERSIVDGPSIRQYIRDTARETGADRHIRFHRRVTTAAWSGDDQRWTVEVERTDTGGTETLSCSFLFLCSGYYRYDGGYTPELSGTDTFGGTVVHPQHWPDDLDYAGKKVVVIGSGATAVTLVPALADKAAHVTMLQRSPSYIAALPAIDPLAERIRRRLPPRAASSTIRWKNVLYSTFIYQLSRRRPDRVRRLLRQGAEQLLPTGYDIDTHFAPSYAPWDQRLCLVPDGDLFASISSGRTSVVTDKIETFIPGGIRLASGTELDADIVVTATGLRLLMFGGIDVSVDGHAVAPQDTVSYKGAMFSGVPNFASTFGYINASWTLKADLIADWVCRLLAHMEAQGHRQVTPRWSGPLPAAPFIGLSSGYVERSVASLPRQGPNPPWRVHQNYLRDVAMFRWDRFDDPALVCVSGRAETGGRRPSSVPA
jgi:monooxygenase